MNGIRSKMAKAIFEQRGLARIRRILAGRRPVAFLGTISAILPTQLLAQTCAVSRPNWDPTSGPVTAWGEAVYMFQSPFGIVLLGVFALAILTFKTSWLLAAGLGAAALGVLVYLGGSLDDPTQINQVALSEGCTGPTSTAVAICAAICLTCAGIFAIKRRLRGEHNA
jgi:hypothetical protein